MKIIKTQEQVNRLKIGKEIANKGCDICPCCGEEYGSKIPACRTWAAGIFKTKYYKVNIYNCDSCGASWESDPYEYY